MKSNERGTAPIETCPNRIHRVLFHGRSDFTTENTEDHGDARRFFAMTPRVSIATVGTLARPSDGPVSPWFPVVLRVLRGKRLRREREPTRSVERTAINAALLPQGSITF